MTATKTNCSTKCSVDGEAAGRKPHRVRQASESRESRSDRSAVGAPLLPAREIAFGWDGGCRCAPEFGTKRESEARPVINQAEQENDLVVDHGCLCYQS